MGRKGKMKYTGTAVWKKIDQITGEIIDEREIDEFERPVGRSDAFMITYLAEIVNLIDKLGNRKMQVVKYILANMEKSNNTLIITIRELSKKTGISQQTVTRTLKILDEAGIIQRRTGAIMVNPRLMNNKKAQGEANMLVKFKQFEENDEEEEPQP